jgi:predicted acetyltransferase
MPTLKHKETYGRLPTSEYQLVDNDCVVGKIQIRHKPSHGVGVPENMASHIYYEILPEYRKKGYGRKILELGLNEAKKIGLSEVYITCMEDNLGSKKIIEANGGVFVEDAIINTQGKKMLKYKILVNKTTPQK